MGVLEQSYKAAMEKPLRVLDIFNEFFGEDRVDMQGFPTLAEVERRLPENSSVERIKYFISSEIQEHKGFILVHFPHVRITNEFDRYTEGDHFFAKVEIDVDGKILGRFTLNRSDYSTLHFTNNYMHSHICNIPINNLTEFQQPCTGSGPINNTICSLARDFDEDLWRLFCLELDRYMQVESIAGTPYHRLESLVPGGRGSCHRAYTSIRVNNQMNNSYIGNRSYAVLSYPQLAEFTKKVIDSNILKFAYVQGAYHIAMSPEEYYIKISNLFIKWYNRKYRKGEVATPLNDLLSTILGRYKYSNGQILLETSGRVTDYRPYIGRKVCTFKGRDILLTICDATNVPTENNDVILLRQDIAEYIYTKIFNVLNFRYGNRKEQGDNESCKKVYYI